MILEKLIVENFGLFSGVQEITFAADYPRNVTLIVGAPCSGKSTLIRAVRWLLYGSRQNHFDNHLIHEGVATRESSDARPAASVSLVFRVNGHRFRAERTVSLAQQRALESGFSIVAEGDSRQMSDLDAKRFIETLLPEQVFSALLLNAENLPTRWAGLEDVDAEAIAQWMGNSVETPQIQSAIRHYVLNDVNTRAPKISPAALNSFEAIRRLVVQFDSGNVSKSAAESNVLTLAFAVTISLLGAPRNERKDQAACPTLPLLFDHFLGCFDSRGVKAVTESLTAICSQQIIFASPFPPCPETFLSSDRIGRRYHLLSHLPLSISHEEREFAFGSYRLKSFSETLGDHSEICELAATEGIR
jgi:hypothetical protein